MIFRTTYFHSLETLFSFICGSLQAPDCILGWLQFYSINQLTKIVKNINNREKIKNKLNLKKINWNEISKTINLFTLEDQEKEIEIKNRYGILWKKLADDFLNENTRLELTCIKHGFQIKPGGFHLSIGREKEYGVPAPKEDMVSIGGSEFGSSYYKLEKIINEGNPNRRFHFRIKNVSMNWNPSSLAYRSNLISMSLRNVISFLKICNGIDPKTIKFSWPSDLSIFDKAWIPVSSVSRFEIGRIVKESDINSFKKEEIINIYQSENSN